MANLANTRLTDSRRAETGAVALELSDVTLTFPDGDRRITAVDGASLTARRGELTAITGPSGSGKSSLLAIAAGLITPDSGKVTLHGATGVSDMTGLSRRELAKVRREQIGIVFQQANLISSLTAIEQLEVTARLGQQFFVSAAQRRRVHERAMDLLDAVGLADRAHARTGQLSGGQRQRVNIARALMSQPSLLVIDEPTSALDSARGAAIIELIVGLVHETDAAALLVTHDLSHIDAMDAHLTVCDGKVDRAGRW